MQRMDDIEKKIRGGVPAEVAVKTPLRPTAEWAATVMNRTAQ